jgi:S-adenosylmethionine/arginine decarboxylase-like enzyme
MRPWGLHAIVNAFRCKPHLIQNKLVIHDFSVDLVKKIDMVAYGQPLIQHFGVDDKAGFTLVQLIETSNITGHFCDESGDAYLDIFSCKEFNAQIVKQVIQHHFQPQAIDLKLIERQAGRPMGAPPHCCLNLQ